VFLVLNSSLLIKYLRFFESRISCAILVFLLLSPFSVFAEGSKELNEYGGSRAHLLSTNNLTASNPFPTAGTMKVYAIKGEKLYLGSSAQGIKGGQIIVRSPAGNAYASSTLLSTTGQIKNRTQEKNGPLLSGGSVNFYIPFIVNITETGVYEIDFISPVFTALQDPADISADGNWTQRNDTQFIAAFDVSVRNAADTAFITGRTYCNIFGGNLGSGTAAFNGRFKVLTKDGYIYDVNANGQTGWGFAFFVNNKGFKDTAGNSAYQSVYTSAGTPVVVPPVHDPRAADSGSDITHKIFFNAPAADLPAKDPISGNWLKIEPVSPLPTNFSFTGIEGTPGKSGTYPLGSIISFESNIISGYTISIDVDKNGSYTDPKDRVLSETASAGVNNIFWDGLDGLGNPVAENVSIGPSNINLVLKGGEVHFPLIDVESNPNGIIIKRINGLNTNDIVYWNDKNVGGADFSKNGVSSTTNGHKWTGSFGDNKGIDTWAYILSAPIATSNSIEFRQADLEVVSIAPDRSIFCIGSEESYKVVVRNNGPSAVNAAKFNFAFPAEFSSVTFTSPVIAGTASVNAGSISGNQYNAVLNMNNGAFITFTFTGIPASAAADYNLSVNASIMRPADVTDPDATNPDNAAPTNPQTECDSNPSGIGCNNVKSISTLVQKVPVPHILLSN